jgi:hypothetical protein
MCVRGGVCAVVCAVLCGLRTLLTSSSMLFVVSMSISMPSRLPRSHPPAYGDESETRRDETRPVHGLGPTF